METKKELKCERCEGEKKVRLIDANGEPRGTEECPGCEGTGTMPTEEDWGQPVDKSSNPSKNIQ